MNPWMTLVGGPWLVNILTCLCGDIWSCFKEKVGGVRMINNNLDLLRDALKDLEERKSCVEEEVKAGELKGERPLAIVTNWLSQVKAIEPNANRLIADASGQDASSQGVSSNDASGQDASSHGQDASSQGVSSNDASGQDASSQGVSSSDASRQDASSEGVSSNHASAVHPRLSTSRCRWSTDNISNFSLGGKVLKMLTEVRDLTCKGTFVAFTEQAPPPVVKIKNVHETFGLETTLENTWTSLMADKNRILGIYGMGGIGKTTLLALINNKFADVRFKDHFDVIIWVKVKDADIEKIQDKIGKRLGLYDDNWRAYTKSEKGDHIRRVLTHIKKRFVLLLDGLWEPVSLRTIGIPYQPGEKKNKVVFTTRSKDVCGEMWADENVEVKCLEMPDALEFLKHKARIDTLNDEMLDLATKIAEECHCSPLALGVVAPILSSRRSAAQWLDVLRTLVSFPDVIQGMGEELYPVLKLSYDHLERRDAKLCFQYCALFPKAYYIVQDELVEYWIGEGIIDVSCGRERAKRLGFEIINTLVGATMLLKDDESKQKVYMHDMMREMALWIVTNFEHGERFVVKTDAGLSQLPDVIDWTTVTKMSLINNEIEDIPDDPEFCCQARLKTLFLQNNRLVEIVGQFLNVMSTLVVLDLSQNLGLTKLPTEFSKLVCLRYLKLFGTMLTSLPSDFGKLVKLIHLDLESTSSLQSISLISELSKLQVLKFYGSAAALDIPVLEKLKRMKGLEVLTITVKEVDVLEAFLGSRKLARCTQGLYLEALKVSVESFAATFGVLSNLFNLEMINCDIKESGTRWEDNQRHQFSPSTSSNQITPSNTLFQNLSVVVLSSCVGVTDLTWLIYATNLESLSITLLQNLEEVISGKKAGGVGVEPFLNLQVLDLSFLDKLKSIYWSPLTFPKLHRVNIKNCPKLHKLPLDSLSVLKIDALHMEVDELWLEDIMWENGAKNRFLPVTRTV